MSTLFILFCALRKACVLLMVTCLLFLLLASYVQGSFWVRDTHSSSFPLFTFFFPSYKLHNHFLSLSSPWTSLPLSFSSLPLPRSILHHCWHIGYQGELYIRGLCDGVIFNSSVIYSLSYNFIVHFWKISFGLNTGHLHTPTHSDMISSSEHRMFDARKKGASFS